MTIDEISTKARTLAGLLEPLAGQVYFAPECHALYAELGFAASPGEFSGVAMPDGPAYFCSRGSVLGQVPGEVVAAAFGVFNPAVVIPAVNWGWTLTTAERIEQARSEGAIAQLTRILGDHPDGIEAVAELLERAADRLRPEGKPLFAGLLACSVPKGHLGAAWRYADRLREFRGDAHIAAWTSAGFDPVEIGLLTELYWGLPTKTYVRTRAWSDQDLDEGIARLATRGLLADGELTEAGKAEREAVETATDRQCKAIIESIGDSFDDLVGLLTPMAAAIRAASGYPSSGPHDLAAAAARQA
jgi:hypothetical protein